jgi:hypothetical protein
MKKILTQNDKYYIYTDNLDLLNSDFFENGLTLEELIKKIVSNPNFFEQHEITNKFLMEIIDDILVLNQYYLLHNISPVYTFTQDSVRTLIGKGHLELEELQYLTLNTYFNFDKDFINEFQDHLNWNKVILRKANVTGLVSFNVLEKKKINELNLWDLASSFQLEKKFIKKNRQKLNWEIISITNDFTYDELSDYPELINYKADGIEAKIKPIEQTTLNEDGFLAFDNVMDNDKTEKLHKLKHELLQQQQDVDTKEIIDKMAAIRKEVYKDFKPHVVGKTPKPEIKVENIPETPNMIKFEDVFEITKSETKITEELVEDAKVLSHNILSHTFSKTFTIPVEKINPEEAKKTLDEMFNNYKQDIKFEEEKGELILDGKTQIPYEKEIWFPSPNSENIELLTDISTSPLTDTFVSVKEGKKVSIIGRIINKIKNIFNGK